jgi:hypothetical protein
MTCQPPIPPLDFAPDNFFAVNVPDSFVLPQANPYCANLTAEQITLLIAGVLAMTGLDTTPAELQTETAEYIGTGFAQSLQVPGLLWTQAQVVANMPPGLAGLVYSADWSGGQPGITPPSDAAIGIDKVTRRQWQFAGGGWT